jgi:hypothetical protein
MEVRRPLPSARVSGAHHQRHEAADATDEISSRSTNDCRSVRPTGLDTFPTPSPLNTHSFSSAFWRSIDPAPSLFWPSSILAPLLFGLAKGRGVPQAGRRGEGSSLVHHLVINQTYQINASRTNFELESRLKLKFRSYRKRTLR